MTSMGTTFAGAASAEVQERSLRARWLIVTAAVLASAIAAVLIGINEYSSTTSSSIGAAQRGSKRFEAVYTDAAQSQVSALRLGVEMASTNPTFVDPFTRNDRPALLAAAVAMFNDTLKPRFNISQFNFWTPPATLYLRAVDPKEFGTDGSAARRSIATAIERRAAVSGMETGLGGRLTLRAIAPIIDGTRIVGVTELGYDLIEILRRAQASTGVEFAAGLDRKRSDEVERVPDKAADAIQGTDVFFEYSSQATGQLVRSLSFNARDTAGSLIQANGKSVFARPFVIANFSGVPTVVVATVFDLTQSFADAQRDATTRASVIFVVLSIAAVFSLLQFQKIQRGFARVMFGEHQKLQQTTQSLETARKRLKDVDLVKQGFFTNVVAAVSEPLQAVQGQMQAALPAIQAFQRAPGSSPDAFEEALARLAFSSREIGRLSRLLTDYRKVELFRQKLVKEPQGQISLATVVTGVIEGELARFKRLPQLSIRAAVAESLPPVRISAEMLRYALTGLVSYAVENGGSGSIDLVGSLDEGRWVRLSIAGTAYAGAGTPTEVLLEDARQFIARLRGAVSPDDANGTMMALVLARSIVEDAGGRLDAAASPATGFLVTLPSSI